MENQTCSSDCNCGSCSCDSYDFYEEMEEKLMGMAFFAHKSILFDKIRDRIEKEQGDKLDKIADLVVQASKEKFESEQEAEKKRAELMERLKEVFEK